MNMTSIHSNSFSFQSQQLQYQNQTQEKIDNKIVPKKSVQVAESKSLEITAESLTIETDTNFDYDLENITPDETMKLAATLHQNGEISFQKYLCLACIAGSHQFHSGLFTETYNQEPFNLEKELQQSASGTSNHNFTNPSMDTEASELLDVLLSLPDKTTKIDYTSIDIKL